MNQQIRVDPKQLPTEILDIILCQAQGEEKRYTMEVGEERVEMWGMWTLDNNLLPQYGTICIILMRKEGGYRCYFTTCANADVPDDYLKRFTRERGTKLGRRTAMSIFNIDIPHKEWAWWKDERLD